MAASFIIHLTINKNKDYKTMQNKALKIVTGALPSTNTEKIHVETNTPKLDLQP
jgi:hypothetical protein